jgi:ribose 5-phosphate isomerase B
VILLACDHAGLDLKRALIARLERSGLPWHDLGVHDQSPVDYPDLAHRLAERISQGGETTGVLVCGTGVGMCMAANRHRGIRAALCHDLFTAEMARRHNDANVLCLGARVLSPETAEQLLDIFLATPFEGGRHERRVAKIELPAGGGA